MAKRFTDTNKYKKPFIRTLPGAYKLLWDFLYHDCDHAGIWIVDFEIAQMYIGSDMPVTKEKSLDFFNSDEQRIVVFDNSKKWFIPSFIMFQYGQLSEKNRAHINVISVLKKYNLIKDFKIKVLTSPLQVAKEKEQDKEQEQETFEKSEKLLMPFTSENFQVSWQKWKEYRRREFKRTYKSGQSEQAALTHLKKLSEGDEKDALEIIEISIANQWHGLFELKKQQKNGTGNNGHARSSIGKKSGGFSILADALSQGK